MRAHVDGTQVEVSAPALVTGLVVDSSPEGWHHVEVTLTGTKP